MAGAHGNGLFIVAADRAGTERGQSFLGCSLIAGPTGFPLAGLASPIQEEVLVATLDLPQAAAARRLNDHNDLLANRRSDQS